MSWLQQLCGILVICSLCGCGKKAEPTAAPSAPAAAQPAAAAPETDYSATLSDLTQALRKFSAEQRRVPASLNELVTGGYLKQLPSAPAGKSFAIEPKELKVVLK